jgi:two-component system cell cycle sensor histidine kinase/response regulator CckA
MTTDLTGQGTILLVEDDESVRLLTARGLRSRGFTVIEASNGLEALKALDEQSIDLLVSDVVMPEMDGPALAKAMRERNPDLKVVFISGSAFGENVLQKPFSLAQLVAAVKQTIGNHQAAKPVTCGAP